MNIQPTRPILLLTAVLAWMPVLAWGQLRIEITQGVEKPVPVAIVPFAWRGQGPAPAVDVAEVISGDLERSGRFAPIPEEDMLQTPSSSEEVDFADWRILGVEVLLIGQVSQSADGRYELQYRLFDVFRGRQILGYRLPVPADNLRGGGHRAADMVYEKLTGIPGLFSTRVAFVSVKGRPGNETYGLVVMDADGENRRTIVESRNPLMSPAWSPDGRKLAYVSFENDNSEVFVQVLRSGARRRVSSRAGINSAPAWSPDGRMLALTLSKADGNLDVYTLDLSNQVLNRLTTGNSIDTEAAWSDDGKHIYFTSDRSGGPQVYRIPAEGGSVSRITFEGRYNARPRLSPDGKQIAVVHNDRGNYRIALVDPERSSLRVLTDGQLDESPAFAPNGETLIYATRKGSGSVLATISVDGRIRREISSGEGQVREPVWSPLPFTS